MQHSLRTPASVRIMVELGAQHGLSSTACLADSGIDAAALDSVDLLISAEQELQVVANLVAALPDSLQLGVQAGLRFQMTTFGIWGFAILSSPTVRDAIETALRFVELSFVLVEFQFREEASIAQLEMNLQGIPTPLHPFVIGRHSAVLFRLISEVLRSHALQPNCIKTTLPASPQMEVLTSALPCPMHFSADSNLLEYPAAILDIPLPQAELATSAFCQQQCESLLRQRRQLAGLSDTPLQAQIRRLLVASPSSMPGLNDVAKQLCVSPRTLRRQLAQESTGFRLIVDQARCTLAEELLSTAQLNVEQVAERLGYAEASSFVHAFKRWTGQSPGRYKRAALQ